MVVGKMIAYEKDYSVTKHPEWIGLRHKISQHIEETQHIQQNLVVLLSINENVDAIEGRCFV